METGISLASIDTASGERFQPLRRKLGVTTFGMNLLVLEPGQRGRIHRHERQEEVYMVLEGTLTLLVEGAEHGVEQGQLVRVAPYLRRQLVNKHPHRLAILAVGGSNEHEGRDGVAFIDWDDTTGRSPQEIPLPDDVPVGLTGP